MELRPPESTLEWDSHHQIRREVLFEQRGRGTEYDPDHPDEHRPGNHPKILLVAPPGGRFPWERHGG